MPRYEARWSWSGNLAMSNDTASFAAVLGCLGPRVGDPHTLTPANKEIAKTPPGTSAIDVEVPGSAEALRGVCSLIVVGDVLE